MYGCAFVKDIVAPVAPVGRYEEDVPDVEYVARFEVWFDEV